MLCFFSSSYIFSFFLLTFICRFQNVADCSYVPCIDFFGGSIFVNFRKLTIFLVVDVPRRWNFFLNQNLRNFPCSCAMYCKVKNFLDYPRGVGVNSKFVLVLWVAHITERCSCERALTCCKLGVKSSLNLTTGIFCHKLVSQPFIKNDCL